MNEFFERTNLVSEEQILSPPNNMSDEEELLDT